MEVPLRITKEQILGKVPVTVFHLEGWLDAQSEEHLLASAKDAHDGGSCYLLLDLAKVDTLTSAGMRAMQKVYKIYTPEEDHFKVSYVKLCNAPPMVYHILGITGFLHNIPNYDNQAHAIAAFGK